jgi:peroxiredoxin
MVDHQQFEDLEVQILAISGTNPFSQQMFAASMHLPFPLLSDYPDLQIIQRYDLLTHIGAAKQPVARGAYLLIDKQGIIRGKWLKPPGKVFPNDLLLQAAHEIAASF